MLTLQYNPVLSCKVPDPGHRAIVEYRGISTACQAPWGASRQKGVTLIELMIGVFIVVILLALSAPSFTDWIQGSQIRTIASSMSNGLQIAKIEAVHRNRPVSFYLTSDLSGGCQVLVNGTSWVVSLNNSGQSPAVAADSPANFCNIPPTEPPAAPAYSIQVGNGAEGAQNALINSFTAATFVTFTGLGRASNSMAIDITNPTGGACTLAGGRMHCLCVLVSTGGQVRMCDPALANDPQGCPAAGANGLDPQGCPIPS